MPFDGAKLNPTAAHLLRAKEYIQEHGWHCGGTGRSEQAVCMAVAVACVCESSSESTFGYLQKAVEDSRGVIGIFRWNDAPDRTLDEVYAAFDKAIALAMADGGNDAL